MNTSTDSNAFDFTKFPGLWMALKGFKPIDMLTYTQDTGYGYGHVYLFKFEFNEDRKYGLFIWDNKRGEFIQEPAPIADYGFKSISQVYKKYNGLRPKGNISN
jgi:hypothetical protein